MKADYYKEISAVESQRIYNLFDFLSRNTSDAFKLKVSIQCHSFSALLFITPWLRPETLGETIE